MSELRSTGLYRPEREHSACGVGFITRKDSVQHHDVIVKADEALCAVPHRGGMSSEGVGDGAGVNIDLSVEFFSALTGRDLEPGGFGVGNFFLPAPAEGPAGMAGADDAQRAAEELISLRLADAGLETVLIRDVPVDTSVLRPAALKYQFPIKQWVFVPVAGTGDVDAACNRALLDIEALAYTDPAYYGLYPLSLSARTQVLKGRLNSNEVIPYFADLRDERHSVHTLFFHTRYSTNTQPHPTMAQPFRLLAHNGELNTDRKNRISDEALAFSRKSSIVRPPGQSDSCRLDQTLQSRLFDDDLDLIEAVVSLMPPAWEHDRSLAPEVRDMLEFFSLYEEKNDGPAAFVFGNGRVVGARLDRLGLRPLRTIETRDYLVVSSESGQVYFDPEEVVERGRIEAGGMICYDHERKKVLRTEEALAELAARRDYSQLLKETRITREELGDPPSFALGTPSSYSGDMSLAGRYVSYSLNIESFRFMMDPMLATGAERISAMGYGNAINALSDQEGGMAKYFSQRFAQVTNPPLDSVREAGAMTLRVALGVKPSLGSDWAKQIIVDSPVLTHIDMAAIRNQDEVPVVVYESLFTPKKDPADNAASLQEAIEALCDEAEAFAQGTGGIIILSDRHVASDRAPIPLIMMLSALNQRLIRAGLRLRASIIAESGQLPSSHHVASALGFGASAVYPLSVQMRADEKYGEDGAAEAFGKFKKAAEKSLLKTMGRVGLCTVESYIGGEFFEPNYLDTHDPVLARYFPNQDAPVRGVGFERIAHAAALWHERAVRVREESEIPMLGLFKERQDGAGHSFGTTAVRGFVDMTEERLALERSQENADDSLRLLTLGKLEEAFGLSDEAYQNAGYAALSDQAIDSFQQTPGYKDFVRATTRERQRRPSALRDVLSLPGDVSGLETPEDLARELSRYHLDGNNSILIRGLQVSRREDGSHRIVFDQGGSDPFGRLTALAEALMRLFGDDIRAHWIEAGGLVVRAQGRAGRLLELIQPAPGPIRLDEVQPAHEITRALASGAMSHGALVAAAHESVAHGVNMVGGMSNCGEGGEHYSRYGTIRGSRIKQFASARFGVWTGYLADPMLEEIEIKIGQGAKPGEGGQLPAPKVTVDIAAARGGTPGVELVSPPPHHDTYSIEDLAQLIHDAKAARVRVIVKLVSSEGIGTIAVGVAKAGADVINVAGNTGGTGAAAVTSLKYAGRSAELGIAEVHQALCANGLRQKVVLRCSGAHQTGADVVASALLGGDSFEFGTTALMMLKCVMAKNCNIKCPAGLTTNPEAFDGDPRALAQYLLNIAHDVREILARLGLPSLEAARGRTDLLQLLDHPAAVGDLDARNLLAVVPEPVIEEPVYLEKDYAIDDSLLEQLRAALIEDGAREVEIGSVALGNRNKSVGAQLSIDIERMLNHSENPAERNMPAAVEDDRGRRRLPDGTVRVATHGSAGQSYGAFLADGLVFTHTGMCNDGVGKGQSGGTIAVRSPGGGSSRPGGNVLIGNFALFGATGGRTFIAGEAGDRFAVRNSGGTAVVEGVGEFCCEYMTNGAVLNLGHAGVGLGSGMSGGFLYQYDPEGAIAGNVTEDSLLVLRLGQEETQAEIGYHETAIRLLLEWHVEATGSELGARLLADWENARGSFFIGFPKALLQYQDADEILASKDRKELLDELSQALAADRLQSFKQDMSAGQAVLAGQVPRLGDSGLETVRALLSSYVVYSCALEIALSRIPEAEDGRDPRVQDAARKLILTQDFFLRQRITKYTKARLESFEDQELAAMIAAKRLGDYKESLAGRNVRSMDAPGTYGWILFQTRKNHRKLAHIDLDALFYDAARGDLARGARELMEAIR
ncbi:glutamate synthase-related protein [Sediminivirga luteola]|uniref:glutamate synthase-related protein n=1 Tax=Sediminivirga luteola TaxID=1774748 RepID=UPI001F5A3691|nr:glutamate synthase-related protein [Sediminivirga luteola]MCI2265263.1 glutamate synthase-related protein [Sediminivirga luteola]